MSRIPHAHRCAALFAIAALGTGGCDDKTPKAPALEAEITGRAPFDTSARPLLLVFSRDYCIPCQVMKPWVAELATEAPSVDVVTLNVDRKKYEHLGNFFKISAVPTLVYLEADGRVARHTEGLAKKAQMLKALEELAWVH